MNVRNILVSVLVMNARSTLVNVPVRSVSNILVNVRRIVNVVHRENKVLQDLREHQEQIIDLFQKQETKVICYLG
jgi:hypothetical protein